MLRDEGFNPQEINGRPENEAFERERVASAGQLGQMTVATFKAARSTDIAISEEAAVAGGLRVELGSLPRSMRTVLPGIRARGPACR